MRFLLAAATLLTQELARPRHARRDPLANLPAPASLGTPLWHPVTPSRADDARDELLAAVVFEKRRGTLPPSVHGALVTWLEARG